MLDNLLVGAPAASCPTGTARARLCKTSAPSSILKIDPDAQVASLSTGERQQLEITRLLWLGVRAHPDEPTTAISAQQRAKLFAALAQAGRAGQDGDLRLA
ncbi:MAG: hypothetical protein IPO15_23535 [Anaerolineae bacterium]|nr:hypothetical protein [Anaerolineae bacterium]